MNFKLPEPNKVEQVLKKGKDGQYYWVDWPIPKEDQEEVGK
jgi:hypothetical protein